MTEPKYQAFNQRWVNLFVYTAVAFAAGAGFLATAPLVVEVTERWDVNFATASLLISVFGLFQSLLSIISGWLSGKIGFKVPVSTGVTLLAVGLFLRSTASDYSTFMLYSIVAAAGFGLVWGPSGSVVVNWFPMKEIGLATSVWNAGMVGGQAFGSLTSIPFMLNVGWSEMWHVYAVIAAVAAVLAWVLFRSSPEVPPEPRPPLAPPGLAEGIKQVLNRTNSVLQYVVLAATGALATAPALIPPILIDKGVADETAGVVTGLTLVGSTIGMLVVPPLAFSRQRAKTALATCALLSPIFLLALSYAPVSGGTPALPVVFSLLTGFTLGPIVALSIGMGQMQPGVHPGNAGILTGVFLTSIGVGVLVVPAVAGWIVDLSGLLAGTWSVGILAALSFVALNVFTPKAPTTQSEAA